MPCLPEPKNEMKPFKRHAAALALLGWYLMTAPSHPNRGIFDARAPLSQWHWRASFDTASECMKERAAQIQRGNKLARVFGTSDGAMSLAAIYRCIATDDPRLKEK
jgi:hypothetical protein